MKKLTKRLFVLLTAACMLFGSIGRIPVANAETAVENSIFDGLRVKANSALTDYGKITTGDVTDDVSGKALALRVNVRSASRNNVELEPKMILNGTEVGDEAREWAKKVYYLSADGSMSNTDMSWSFALAKNFNGWVIWQSGALGTKQPTDRMNIAIGMHNDWSGLVDFELGYWAAFDMPADAEAKNVTDALMQGKTIYSYSGDGEALNSANAYEFGIDDVTLTRTSGSEKRPQGGSEEKPEKTVDGYFDGLNLKITSTLTTYGKISVKLAQTDFAGKALAVRMYKRGGGAGSQIDFKPEGLSTPEGGLKYWTIDEKAEEVSEKIFWWCLEPDDGFVGWYVMPIGEMTGTFGGAFNLGFGEWSKILDLDLGNIVSVDIPQNKTYKAFAAALESKTVLYDFAKDGKLNSETAVDEILGTSGELSRVNGTLTIEKEHVIPAYCAITGDTKVMNFALSETDDLSGFVGNAENYPVCEFSLTNRGTQENVNNALHVKLGRSTESFTHSAIEIAPRGYGAKIEEEAKGLSFYVRNYSDKSFYMNVGFDLGHRWYTKWSGNYAQYQLYNTKTGVESVQLGGYEGLYIPAGFEGYVRVAFTQFVPANWVAVPLEWSEAVNGNSVTYMSIDVNTDTYAGLEFDVDDIGWYYGDATVKTSFLKFSDTVKSIAEMMANTEFFKD